MQSADGLDGDVEAGGGAAVRGEVCDEGVEGVAAAALGDVQHAPLVLTGLGDLNVCTRYRGAEEATFTNYPYHQTVMHQATGEYEQLWRRRMDRFGAVLAESTKEPNG